VFWADRAFWAGDERLTGTVWKHQSDKGTIVVEFGRLGYIVGSPVVRYTTTQGSATGRGSVTYTALDDTTLSLANSGKLTIDSISSENRSDFGKGGEREGRLANQRLKLTGAAILVCCDATVLMSFDDQTR
jgi:hypothetical protein